MTSFPYRFSPLLSVHGSADFDFLPATLPTVRTAMESVYVVGWGFNSVLNYFECLQVGTNLTDLTLKKKKVTVRELGGCMSPIWPSYFKDCSSVIFVVDSANIAQISSSCIQLLSVLSAKPLCNASVLILFNKRDVPCVMTPTEMKSLFRMDDIIASATQPITVLELSARSGQGLQEVLRWLESIAVK
uniref:ADP-ribosylation factor-like 16 n=1 Tax=Oryzias latipes TaxID=8090 RepID=A0A3B3HTX9_ORYLA